MYTFSSDTIIILDTEYTSWEGAQERKFSGPNEFREIIQIAAIVVDTKTFHELDHFSIFVKPSRNPILSDFIKNLTNISQEQVDGADDFITAIEQFRSRVGDYEIYSFGNDGLVIAENCDLNAISFPFDEKKFHDVREVFRSADIPAEKYTSGTINQYFGTENIGTEHNALDDVRNILGALKKLYLK